MAPEQLAAQPVGPAADVFGLGVVLYEMLAGHRPFAALTPVALATEQHQPRAPIEGVPGPLNDVVLRAIAIDPQVRPSAHTMAATLRGWLAAPLISDAPTAPVTLATPAVAPDRPAGRRRPALVTAGLAAAGVLIVALVALAAIAPPAAPGATDPGIAGVDTATQTPRPQKTPVPAAPAAKPKPAATPSPTPAPTSTPSTAQPTNTPPTSTDKPKHHNGHGHHGHGHHRHKHHKKRHH